MCSSMNWISANGVLKASSQQQREGPPNHPAALLKIYIYGYLNRIQSSQRLEREAQRNESCILDQACIIVLFDVNRKRWRSDWRASIMQA